MHYPVLDPIIVSLGPLALRWYGLSYLAGFVVCWWLGRRRAQRLSGWGEAWSDDDVADLVFYGAMGAVLGGRVGYVLFYGFERFLSDPVWLLRIWDGGMSFHGGLIGVLLAFALFGMRTNRSFLQVADFMAPLCPPGLGFGRLANFINTELPGRVTDAPTGLVYPCEAVYQFNPLCLGEWENVARHPSPLYQAATEGLLLFLLLWWFASRPRGRGAVAGLFLLGYGCFRFGTEFFRQPDAGLGFIAFDWLSMGQLLSLPMVLAGGMLLLWSRGQKMTGNA
ncbi:MAG: prolipoprotein diacylglyceryl transferase [Pseudomonadota bacterium]